MTLKQLAVVIGVPIWYVTKYHGKPRRKNTIYDDNIKYRIETGISIILNKGINTSFSLVPLTLPQISNP